MKKSKAISLLLCLSLLASLLIPGTLAMPAKAAEGGTDNGMVISKTATANTDGTYTIQLEAYATGSKIISDVKKDVPTDIVLVLDQSGSMDDPIGTVSFTAYKQSQSTNSRHYNRRHNGGSGNLYYPLSDDSYAAVSVTKQEALDYKPLSTNLVNYKTYWGSLTDDCYYYYANNLYEKVGDGYKPVTLIETSSGGFWSPTYTYTYTFSDGTSVTSTGRDSKPRLGSHGPLYYSAVDTIYTYSYTDVDGIVQTIGTSTGDNTQFTKTLYQRIVSTNGGGSRLNALKSAVTTFANNVAKKAKGSDGLYGTDDDVNHRIAVVSFADSARNLTNGFIDMDKANGLTSVTGAVNGLRANGNTYPAAGIKEANNIFSKNSIESGKRNRVIVLFTDGYPAPAGTDDIDYVLCDNAISSAYTSKHNYGATVYTVAIFSGANPNSDIDSNYERDSINATKQLVAANRYMHYTSSNYPDARSMENGGSKAKDGYYLSAADADTLNNIFQKISDQIESGGSSTTLGRETVIKDIVAPAFDMPKNPSDIKVYTAASNGSTTNWNNRVEFKEGAVTPDTENSTISVSGFSFKDNWCGTETKNGEATFHDGKKLIIEFTVTPKADFLGGNNVYTNTSAGVYENSSATSPVMEFNRPQVNVPINNVTVTAENKNVYLLSDLTADQIKSGATVKCGEVSLDLSKATDTDKPYGLDPWQTEYVDITVTVKDKDGNSISDKLENLTEDTTYTVEVTVSPKTKGTSTPEKGDAATAKTGINDPAANIYVFKPELTFKDSTAYYGESVPTNNDYSSNKVGSETWKHGDTASTDEGVTMLGTEPTLDISYTPDESKLEAGKYTKQDVPVAATVKIGTENINGHTTFLHQGCSTACGWETPATPGAPAFLIHIQTCQLTITKTGGAADESYVFDVYKDGSKYSEVTIWGNGTETIVELPVGTYTIQENTGWSWRYKPTYNVDSASLAANSPTGAITCTNTKGNDYWLNGYSDVVTNTYESKN
ncbi:MAG: VWA domain-containing protein [Clostridiales bacterium]|nr:VWA domain-containing protein [Clostridiales bacterium]